MYQKHHGKRTVPKISFTESTTGANLKQKSSVTSPITFSGSENYMAKEQAITPDS
jgi:hypothetical protein